ncbi:hypothetical protein SAMN05444416_101148 [Thermoactinomyces sp. DSM 45892]|nr:hypothetical protein SAMN05444416_101148 [Thermoactinomyces sp. DSM 45892]
MSEIKTILQTPEKNLLVEWIYSKMNELSNEVDRYRQIIIEMNEMIEIERNEGLIQRTERSYDILIGMRNVNV